MRNLIFCLTVIFASISQQTVAYGGDKDRISRQIFLFPQNYTIESYYGIGFSNIAISQLSDISNANPASLADFRLNSSGLTVEYHSAIESAFVNNIELNRDIQYIPQSAGFNFSIKNTQFGLGFNRMYSSLVQFEAGVTTITNPDSISQYIYYKRQDNIFSGSGLVARSFQIPNLMTHQFSIGIQFDGDYFITTQKIEQSTGKLQDWAFSWKAGVRYQMGDNLILGVIFDKGSEFSGQYKSSSSFEVDDSLSELSIESYVKTPSKIIFGGLVKHSPWLEFTVNLGFVYWNKVWREYQNNPEFSVSLIFKKIKRIQLLAGFYQTDFNRQPDDFSSLDYEALYISGGVLVSFKKQNLSLVLSDSHLASAERSKKTIIKFSIDSTF